MGTAGRQPLSRSTCPPPRATIDAMTRRRRRLFLSYGGIVVALAVAWVLWPRPVGITRENAARIKQGMTLSEVKAILGGPGRIEATDPNVVRDGAANQIIPQPESPA